MSALCFNMKKLFFSLGLYVLSILAYGQPQTYESYFSENILSLDPIEGIWDVNGTITLISSGRSFDAKNTYYIKKNGNGFSVYSSNNSYNGSIVNIGETNVYNFNYCIDGLGETTCRIYLEGNNHFIQTCSMGRKAHLEMDCVKSYPTSGMYQQAELERRKNEKDAEEKLQKESILALPQMWTGTGFALNNGYIVTNNHVVDGASKISVLGIEENVAKEYAATVVSYDKNNDLALLRLSGESPIPSTIPYALVNRMCDVGEDIFVLGYPLTTYMGNEVKLTNGLISSRSGYQGDITTYQISAPIQPGCSGAPVFDKNGNIIGIINAGIPGADNVGYAIKSSYLFILANTASITNLPQTNKISGLSLVDKVKTIKKFVYIIKCEK